LIFVVLNLRDVTRKPVNWLVSQSVSHIFSQPLSTLSKVTVQQVAQS